MTNEEWEQRYRQRIQDRLLAVGTEQHSTWTVKEAEDAALLTFNATELADLMDSFEDDPEGAADEELSYWDDDGG